MSVLGEKPLQTNPPSMSLPIALGDESMFGIIFYMEKRKKAIQNIGVFLIVGTFKCLFKGMSYKGIIRVLIYSIIFLLLGELNI